MQIALVNAKLIQHGVERARLDLVLEIAHDRHSLSIVQGHVTAFSPFRIEPDYYLLAFAKRLYLLDKLAPLHIGYYRTSMSDWQSMIAKHLS